MGKPWTPKPLRIPNNRSGSGRYSCTFPSFLDTSVKADNGIVWKYPLSIEFFK
jgi:hypothetical protein